MLSVRPRPGLLMAGLFAVAGAELAACGDDRAHNAAVGELVPERAGTLTVATSFPAAGFWEGADVDHVTGGFEYELAKELADVVELDELEVVDLPFADLVAGRAEGFDLALAQVSITDERAEVVDLSEPYLTTPIGVVGRPGLDVPDLATARSLTWAVAESTTEVDVVDDRVAPDDAAEIVPTTADALAAVAERRVDLAAVDYLSAWAEAAADDRLAVVAQINVPQHYGALLPKGSRNLGPVDAALRQLAADGTLRRLEDDLYDRYGIDVDRVPTIRVSP